MSPTEKYFLNKVSDKLFGIHFGAKSKIEKQAEAAREFARAEGVSVGDILVAINRASYSKLK
jgi:hypothetical protein